MFYRLLTFPPHPEERSEAERLEGWQREGRSCHDNEVQRHRACCHQRRGGYPTLIETLRFAPFLRVR